MRFQLFQTRSLWIALALILASFAFTNWGFIWYATVFDDVWQSLIGRSEEELVILAEQRGFLQTFNTYFISLVQACGLLIMCKMTRIKAFHEYQLIAVVLSVLIATPVLGNAVLFAGQSTPLWVLDFMHFILGYAGMALIFWMVFERAPVWQQRRGLRKRIRRLA